MEKVLFGWRVLDFKTYSLFIRHFNFIFRRTDSLSVVYVYVITY